ncbi:MULTISPECIES: DUF7668 domain-containing protein [unclassified Shewanella]|uniref:DUF7668 domain-containing protein n=1 Tax=Shewanella TaxID=22 RepID=UPI0021DAF4D5|nr:MULTISPECIES: hypothetical protein [unclassified Shewanella]MCU8002292.1 hypothetical protein [Shewanella sp. SM96]MCU8042705.1 hypothetical protein [Shewanella sp. SM68]MCU8047079.1 hypothetical protein [Shewanella sp. SM65]MCU8088098.1 hypothetical protein [Shewanella sp. SM21]
MIEQTIRHIYSLLLSENYDELERFTNGSRMSSNEICEAILEYGYQLVSYPDNLKLNIVEVKNSSPREWSVVAPIYTSEEGLSDLSIELSLIENGKELYKSELDNIRVR